MAGKSAIILLALAFAVGVVYSQDSIFKEVHAKCREENQLTEEEYQMMNQTRHLDTDDQRLKCFVKCVLIGLELMNAEGEFNVDEVKHKNFKNKEHLPECTHVTGTDACDKAVNFKNCLWERLDAKESSQ